MNFSLETLEYENGWLELVSRHAQTPMGEGCFAELRPKTSRAELDADLAAIAETVFLNEERQASWSFSGLEDPTEAVAILKIKECDAGAASLCLSCRVFATRRYLPARRSRQKKSCARALADGRGHSAEFACGDRQINKKLLPSGEIDDSASPELNRLRREISNQRSRLTKSLESLMRSSPATRSRTRSLPSGTTAL